jgi:hypothetical protein
MAVDGTFLGLPVAATAGTCLSSSPGGHPHAQTQQGCRERQSKNTAGAGDVADALACGNAEHVQPLNERSRMRDMVTPLRGGSPRWCLPRRTSIWMCSPSAINRVGPLAGKITFITATNDRALALSGRIAGGMTRVGAAGKAAIERLHGQELGLTGPGVPILS